MAAASDISLMLPMLAAVLAGSVFGDHSSPISSTSILSATGAGCHHIDHVMTQLPYALAIAFGAAMGYLVMGMMHSVLAGFTVKIIDGNALDGREHRLKESRGSSAAPLPGKVVAVLDPAREVIEAVVASEDAYTQERALLPEVVLEKLLKKKMSSM